MPAASRGGAGWGGRISLTVALLILVIAAPAEAHFSVNHPDPSHSYSGFSILMPGFYFPELGRHGFDLAASKVRSPCPLPGYPESYGDALDCSLEYDIPPHTYSVSAVDVGDGSIFLHWKANVLAEHCDNSTESSCTFVVNRGVNFGASLVFGFPVNVSRSGSGAGTVRSGSSSNLTQVIDCGAKCETIVIYDLGFNGRVSLQAIPSEGSAFTHWTGNCSDFTVTGSIINCP